MPFEPAPKQTETQRVADAIERGFAMADGQCIGKTIRVRRDWLFRKRLHVCAMGAFALGIGRITREDALRIDKPVFTIYDHEASDRLTGLIVEMNDHYGYSIRQIVETLRAQG